MNQPTPEEVKAAILVFKSVLLAIKEVGEAPLGPIYAALMGKMSLDQFETMINQGVRLGFITRQGNMVTWKGIPK